MFVSFNCRSGYSEWVDEFIPIIYRRETAGSACMQIFGHFGAWSTPLLFKCFAHVISSLLRNSTTPTCKLSLLLNLHLLHYYMVTSTVRAGDCGRDATGCLLSVSPLFGANG